MNKAPPLPFPQFSNKFLILLPPRPALSFLHFPSLSKMLVEFSPEVAAAKRDRLPIVALESTIIAHGMPYPQNVETARAVEQAIRKEGAVPATIAILGGKLKAGLTDAEMELLGNTPGIWKVSRRDMPLVVAQQLHGATTVASTMIIAEMAGIQVFATGGIGGVHRGAQETMDISADLQELAQTNVAVVSAGAKAILDLGLTLEYLETMGVPVIGYQTNDFPAFYTRSSGFPLELRADTPEAMAAILKTKWDLGLRGGVLIANPIPAEYSMNVDDMNAAIDAALLEAQQLGIKGKAVTPFLLGKIKSVTQGKSLTANIQLVLNNAKLAAKVAMALIVKREE